MVGLSFSRINLKLIASEVNYRRIIFFLSLAGLMRDMRCWPSVAKAVELVRFAELIEGLIRLMNGHQVGPINLGNPNEFTIRQLAEQVRSRINPDLPLIEEPLPADDPRQRQPDIDLAQQELGWTPSVVLEQGLDPTIRWFRQLLS